MVKKLGIGVLAVIVAVGTTWGVVTLVGNGLPGTGDPQAQLASTMDKLRAGRTARITLTGEIRPQIGADWAAWSATTVADFTAPDGNLWESTYDRVAMAGAAEIKARVLYHRGEAMITSDSFTAADRRPWIKPKRHSIVWRNPLADPTLGLTDFVMWADTLRTVTKAADAPTDELADVEGAEHEFRFRCWKGAASCPQPFGTPLDRYFNNGPVQPTFSAWYDDEGRIRRLEVEGSLNWIDDGSSSTSSRIRRYTEEYFYKVAFVVDDFGTPVTITPPPTDQISESNEVKVV